MADENVFKKITLHALTTATGVLVTFMVTKMIADKQKDKEVDHVKMEVTQNLTESLGKTTAILNSYITKYDSIHTILLAYQSGSQSVNRPVDEFNDNSNSNKPTPPNNTGTVTSALLNGEWMTSDGTVVWSFNNGRVNAYGPGIFKGFIEGNGNYNASGGNVNGSMKLSKAFWIETNETVQFNLAFNSDQTMLYGTITDQNGQNTAANLYKQ